MMTNNKPWEAVVNADNALKLVPAENHLTVVKKDANSHKYVATTSAELVTTKRYSFDDNGGGYQGL
ncbi:MAG: hypothetical protein EON98_04015 [Chitinophagaceae bacterium]|nr:MAG: hypothetical protein EON98_04015 [Chitinophagaceae bacterium]